MDTQVQFEDLPAEERVAVSFAEYKRLATNLLAVISAARPDLDFVDQKLKMDACVLQYAAAVGDIKIKDHQKAEKRVNGGKVDTSSKIVETTTWSTLYALEYHRLKQENGKIATTLSWIGMDEAEIKEAISRYNGSVAMMAAVYADEAVAVLACIQ